MIGGVDALIKIAQGWPALSSPLKLISLKGSENSKDISLTFLCKVEVSIISSLPCICFTHCFFLVHFIVFGVKGLIISNLHILKEIFPTTFLSIYTFVQQNKVRHNMNLLEDSLSASPALCLVISSIKSLFTHKRRCTKCVYARGFLQIICIQNFE